MLLAGTDEHDLTKLGEYRAIGGYEQVPKALAMTSDELIAELQKANLRGRGGAGFPMGRKASLSIARARSRSTWSSTQTSPSRAPSRTAR
jgi:NADH-quinone oxidoreductase subunit F